MSLMRRKLSSILLLCLAFAAIGVIAGCGEESSSLEAVEGEALEVGPLSYNVQITRALNPSSADDAAYLEGLEPAPPGKQYLAVFMRIINDTDMEQRVPSDFEIHNSREVIYEPLEVDNPFALQVGAATVAPDGEIPAPNTPAASGPIKGLMLLFLVEQADTDNRPLELEIPGPDGGTGRIELDI